MSSQHESVAEFVARAAQGDRKAASRLLERYRERLLQMVCVWVEHDRVTCLDSDDLVRRTMDAALEQLLDGVLVNDQSRTCPCSRLQT